ncbi:MAG: NAD(P)-dependent alcohol dehydrogenase [Burkholderiaceae bacterium]
MTVQATGGLGSIGEEPVELREPGPGEITVRIRANSLNYHDYLVVSGKMRLKSRRIPLSDGAGEIVAAGAAVGEFGLGDHVVSTFFPNWIDGEPVVSNFSGTPGDGVDGYAREFVTAPASAFTRAPAGYSFAEAATLTTAGVTAWRALFVEGSVKPGDTVLVQGTGGVSVFALQLAKAAGARVIATSSSDEKLQRMRELGADHALNYRSTPAWGKAALELTAGRGVDHVIDVGGGATLEQSLIAARVAGRVTLVGILGGPTAAIPVPVVFARQLRLTGLLVGSRRHQLDMVRGLEAAGIRPVIDRHFPLSAMAEAFAYQESQRHFGKIVLDV